MKKLMFAAAIAAVSAGVFAADAHLAQVYQAKFNVKTTECKKAGKLYTDALGESMLYYRAKTAYTFAGLFWGCGCYVIANPLAEQYGQPNKMDVPADDITCDSNNNSYMFWGPKAAFHYATFQWDLLHLIGKKSNEMEGVFASQFFICEDGEVVQDVSLDLVGAGYGTASVNATLPGLNVMTKMDGYVTGIYNVADASGMVGCLYCGSSIDCVPKAFCEDCVEVREKEAAAYGTFTIKYDSTVSKKVRNGYTIEEAYPFKKFVLAEFDCIAADL